MNAPDFSAAKFITAAAELSSVPAFVRRFSLDIGHGAAVSATLRLSALGVCEAWINEAPVSDDLFTPGWTSYEWRVREWTYDVTSLLAPESVIVIQVGPGWYAGRLGWKPTRPYGSELAAYCDLRIRFEDGHTQVVLSDEDWRVAGSEILSSDIYDGQRIDMRLRDRVAWRPTESRSGLGTVRVVESTTDLVPAKTPPVRRIEELPPRRLWRTAGGRVLVDFGKNVVGWVRLSARRERGSVVTVRHGEVLEDGALATVPLRTARATDEFTFSGGDDIFEPTFTFHGFQYVEVEGWGDDIRALEQALVAVVVSSDLRRTGWFECSDEDINAFHANVVQSVRGNFLAVPTDCPQRDERMGWTGDIAVFAPTAAFLFDVEDFLADWLRDLALEQKSANGVVPLVVPNVLKRSIDEVDDLASGQVVALWSDAAVWVPWAVWQAYGDSSLLVECYSSMAAHGRALGASLSVDGVFRGGFQFGDWLDPDAPNGNPGAAKADSEVVATACAHRTATMLESAATVLQRTEDADEWRRLARRIRGGFRRAFVSSGRVRSDCATVYALAIEFGLLEPDERDAAGCRLAELVGINNYKISTGFAGTPFLLPALTNTGHFDAARRLLLQTECPSWLFPVTMGATTVWERWDSMLPDGSVNPGAMTSFNHYALGSMADWLHRVVGGISPIEPGYSRILIQPCVEIGLDWARASIDTEHGVIRSSWARSGLDIVAEVEVPTSSTAVVRLPGRPESELGPGRHRVYGTLKPAS